MDATTTIDELCPPDLPVPRTAGWARRLAPAGIFVAVRLVGVLILGLIGAANGRQLVPTLHSWDGDWYLRIAATGYSALSEGVDANGHVAVNTTLAFFPGYPALMNVLGSVTGIGTLAAGLLISLIAGIAAGYGITRICAALDVPQWTGLVAVALFASTPMSVTLSMVYTEALFTALAVWSLVGIMERNWLLAASCCGLSGLVRSTAAILIAVVCLALIVSVARRRSSPLALLAMVPAAGGLLAYYLFVVARTDDLTGWFQLQKAGWGTAFDGGVSSARFVWQVLTTDAPLMETANVVVMFGALVLAVIAARKLPWPLAAYGIGVVIMTVGSSGVTYSKMRLLLPAITLLIPIAAGLARRDRTTVLCVLVAAALVSGWFGAYALTDWRYAI